MVASQKHPCMSPGDLVLDSGNVTEVVMSECAAQALSCPWTNVLTMAPMSPAGGQEAVLLLESFVLKVSDV